MDEKEKEKITLLLAICKLMGIKAEVMDIRNAIRYSREEIDRFEQGTNPLGTPSRR